MVATDAYQVFTHAAMRGLQLEMGRELRRERPLILNASLVDWMVVSIARAFLVSGREGYFHDLPVGWREAAEPYLAPELQANPQRFFPDPTTPRGVTARYVGRLPGGDRQHVTFESAYRTYNPAYQQTYSSFRGNETVHVRVWRHRGGGSVPTVLCVHGWCGGHMWLEEQIFAASQMYRSGLNVVLTVLPFHGARRPAGRFAGDLFPSSDVRRTNEAFGQAVTDVRSVMRWLRREGLGQRLGLMGFSLGGYVAALVASLEDSLDFVVPVVAPVSLADLVWDQTVAMVGEAAVRAASFDLELFRKSLAVHCPLSHRLRVPAERVLLVGGRADRVVPPQHVQALWEHWGRPGLTWFPGGHYVHFGRQTYLRRACTLMAGARPDPVSAPRRAPLPWLRWFAPLWR